jgi:lysozyme
MSEGELLDWIAQKKSSPVNTPPPQGDVGMPGNAGPPGARNNTPDTPQGDGLVSLVKSFEGWNPNAYDDYGQKSIGYGTRARKGEKSISREEAERRLGSELSKHRKRVDDMNKKGGYGWTPQQLDALTSFDYNTGKLEQLTNNGKRTNKQISDKIPQYRKAGGKVLRGLERRRKAEQALFLNGYAR